MNAALVQSKLVEVLQNIQSVSGLECPQITSTTKPLEVLPQFDSKIWPVAIGMLAAELGIVIADDINIFSREKDCAALTIDETVTMVVDIAVAQVSAIPKIANTL